MTQKKHSFQCGSKKISRIQDEQETRGRRKYLNVSMRKTTPTMFFLLKYANKITHKVWWDIFSLIQGGLKVLCLFTVTIPGSIMNHLFTVRYEKLLGKLCLKQIDEEIMGTSVSVIREKDFVGTNKCTQCKPSSSTKNKKKAEVRSRDIRDMFRIKTKRCDTVVTH